MKHIKFYLICFLISASCLFAIPVKNSVFAANGDITAINLTIQQNNTIVSGEASFNESTPTTPYDSFDIVCSLTITNDSYNKNYDYGIIYMLNQTEITFTNNNYSNTNYSIQKSCNDLIFTPLLPGNYAITAIIANQQNTCNITAKYASIANLYYDVTDENNITTQHKNSLDTITTSYKNIENYLFKVTCLNYDFIDKDLFKNFNWYTKINDTTTKLQQTSNTIQLSKKDIIIGTKFQLIAELQSKNDVEFSINLEITNNGQSQSYPIEIFHTGGELEQTFGNATTDINFSPFIPVSTNYSVTWWLKNPNNSTFINVGSANSNDYTFKTSTMKFFGVYELFATSKINNVISSSDFIKIILNAKQEIEIPQFTINFQKAGTQNKIDVYELSIDCSEYYSSSQIVWYIQNKPMLQGSSVTFTPSAAGNYIIMPMLIESNNSQPQKLAAKPITITAGSQSLQISWVYYAVGAVALIAFGAISIIISNKSREKIW